MNIKSKELIEKLNNHFFYDSENILMGDVLHYTIKLSENVSTKMAIKSICRSILTMLSEMYIYEARGLNIETCCIYTAGCGFRKDHVNAFNDAVNLIDRCVKVNLGKRKLSFRKLKLLPYYLNWLRDLRQIGIKRNQVYYLADTMLRAYSTYETMSHIISIEGIKIKNIVVWCDVMPDDCFVVQKMKQKNIQTVTLCHADFNINENAWAYRGSHSDIFMTHNIHTYNNAIKVGCRAKQYVVGDPHNICKGNFVRQGQYKNDVIGLFLNSEMIGEVNAEMIAFFEAFCKKHNKKLLIKMHPSNSAEKIMHVIDSGITKVFYKEINVSQFAEMIDVAIISNSNVFGEMLYMWKPVFIYAVSHDFHGYDDFEKIKFTNEDELEDRLKLVTEDEFNEIYMKNRSYFIPDGDIKTNYINCYKEIGIN